MRHKAWLTIIILLALIIIAVVYLIFHASISAVSGPGPTETSIAGTVRGWYVSRGARSILSPSIPNNAANVSAGSGLYSMECASCHGPDGRTPTPIGRAMHPRVPSLSSAGVQNLSDKELFWVIKNGVRFSGMPGFTNINSDQDIWQLAYYVRSLGAPQKH